MEIRVLRYFLEIARAGNMSRAAETLHVSQPALSKQMKDLEQELGQRLLNRGNRKISLTAEGVFFRKRAQEIIDLVDKTSADLCAADGLVSGSIHIGCGETEAMRILARAIQNLNNRYPLIQYQIFSGNGDDVMEKLDIGLLDFGVLIEPADIRKYDYLKLPHEDIWGLLMRNDHPLAEYPRIGPNQLENLPLLCSRQTLVENTMEGWLGFDYEKLNVVATYNLIYNAALMVEEGIGCALALDRLIDTSGERPLCFRPLDPPLTANLNLVWKKRSVFSRAAELFLKQVQKEIRISRGEAAQSLTKMEERSPSL